MTTEHPVKLHAEAWIRNDIYQAVLRERAYQTAKWGTPERTMYEWLIILMEEVGEACDASLNHDKKEFSKEILQAIAVGFTILEQYGYEEREENQQD